MPCCSLALMKQSLDVRSEVSLMFPSCRFNPAPRPPKVADTFDVDEARRSYYTNLFPLTPSGAHRWGAMWFCGQANKKRVGCRASVVHQEAKYS
jgi:hypothetical protein